jgi:purine-binding chemotaxis protein CheW
MTALHVLFRVAEGEYALPASEILHMESFAGVTRVPGTRPHVAGLVQIRSRVVPVIDLRVRFGLPAATPTLDSRVMVVQCGERSVGLLAESAREVLGIDPASFRPPPDVVARQAGGFVRAVAQVGSRLIMLMNSRMVIGEEVLDDDHETRA